MAAPSETAAFAGLLNSAVTAANPEGAVIAQLAPHAPTFLMIPLITFAVILALIGIVVLSTASSKLPGVMILLLAGGLGFGAFTIMRTVESKKQ